MASEDCAIGRGVAAVRHKSGSRSFTYYAVHSLKPEFDRFEAEGTVFGCIGKKDFHALALVAPDSGVVAAFDAISGPLDTMIERNENESRTLTALRDALLPKLISGGLRVQGIEQLVEGLLNECS